MTVLPNATTVLYCIIELLYGIEHHGSIQQPSPFLRSIKNRLHVCSFVVHTKIVTTRAMQ